MRLSREQAEQIVKTNGSIIYQGINYTLDNFEASFPTDADLAIGDKVEAVKVVADLDAEIEKLLAEKKKLAETLVSDKKVTAKKTIKTQKDADDKLDAELDAE